MSVTQLREAWEALLRARIGPLLLSLQAGDDAPPALRFKAEGCAETGLALELIDTEQLAVLLDRIYVEATGSTIDAQFGYTAHECIDADTGRVTLPFRMQRAPVHRGSER